jgi:hypothetical protein
MKKKNNPYIYYIMSFSHNSHLNPEQVFLRSNEFSILNNGSKKSSITFNLKTKIVIPRNVDAYIQLNSFKYFNAFYNINSSNNNFYFSLNGGGQNIETVYVLQIPIGNYTISSILSYLNSELNPDIVLTYVGSLFKISFTSASYTFMIRSGVNDCLRLLGFSESTTEANETVSRNLVNLAGTQVLYITLPNMHIQSNSSTSAVTSNILESINVDILGGSSKSFYNSSNIKYRIVDEFVSSIDVMIFDENNNLVDFNNTDWFMSISFIFSYKNDYKPPPMLAFDEKDVEDIAEEPVNTNPIDN